VQAHTFNENWYGYNSESHFWFRWRLAALQGQLRRIGIPLDEPLRALEIGAGVGVLRDQIEAMTRWNVDITDLDLRALEAARPGRGRRMYYDILERRAEFRAAYDVVVLFDVLEHIEDANAFLSAVIEPLRPGGWLLINVPAQAWLFSHYDRMVGHVRRYQRRTLADEFRGLPVTIHDLRYWGVSLVPVAALRKLALAIVRPDSAGATVDLGFKPPHPVIQGLFLNLMRLENAAPIAYPVGSSLLLAARKHES
jgi:SAM-dependent methyltransferase